MDCHVLRIGDLCVWMVSIPARKVLKRKTTLQIYSPGTLWEPPSMLCHRTDCNNAHSSSMLQCTQDEFSCQERLCCSVALAQQSVHWSRPLWKRYIDERLQDVTFNLPLYGFWLTSSPIHLYTSSFCWQDEKGTCCTALGTSSLPSHESYVNDEEGTEGSGGICSASSSVGSDSPSDWRALLTDVDVKATWVVLQVYIFQ